MKLLLKDYFSNIRKVFDIDLPGIAGIAADNNVENSRGFFAEVSGNTFGLVTYGERLFIIVDGTAVEFDESVSVLHSAEGQIRKLVVMKKGCYQLSVEYLNHNAPVSTQYYSEDEEDADFGLWLSEVLTSPERRAIFRNSWMEGAS